MLPFSRDQFVSVFAAYNEALWPAQVLAYGLGLAMLALLLRPASANARWLLAGLAAMWTWTGVVYHGSFFSAINPAALLFAALFVLQGVLLGVLALRTDAARAKPSRTRRVIGWALLAYAAVLYPLVGLAMGQAPAELPAFGLTPCPVVLTTIAVFLLVEQALPHSLWWIPVGWAIVGGSAAGLLDMAQDWPLLLVPLLLVLPALGERVGRRRSLAR